MRTSMLSRRSWAALTRFSAAACTAPCWMAAAGWASAARALRLAVMARPVVRREAAARMAAAALVLVKVIMVMAPLAIVKEVVVVAAVVVTAAAQAEERRCVGAARRAWAVRRAARAAALLMATEAGAWRARRWRSLSRERFRRCLAAPSVVFRARAISRTGLASK